MLWRLADKQRVRVEIHMALKELKPAPNARPENAMQAAEEATVLQANNGMSSSAANEVYTNDLANNCWRVLSDCCFPEL